MIVLSATILPKENAPNYLRSVDINIEENNISRDIIEVVNEQKGGGVPFLLGASKLGVYGDHLTSYVDYYIGSVSSDSSGNFLSNYIITVYGYNLQELVIRFDAFNRQYPNTVTVNGGGITNRVINCDSPILTIGNLDGANQYTISISNWNTPQYPLRIQGVYTVYVEVASNKILSGCNYAIKDRDSIIQPSYGIFSNTSNFSFIDYNDEILFFSEQQVLTSGLELSLYLSNTEVAGSQKLIGKHYTKSWNYDNDNRVCKITLQDNLVDLQKIKSNKVPLTQNVKMSDVFTYLNNKVKYRYGDIQLQEGVSKYLSSILMVYYYLEAGSLWEQFDKFCKSCGLYMYQDKNSKIILSFGREGQINVGDGGGATTEPDPVNPEQPNRDPLPTEYNLWVKETAISDNGTNVQVLAYFVGTAPILNQGDQVIYKGIPATVDTVMHTGSKYNYYISYPKGSVWDEDKQSNTSILGITYKVQIKRN